MGLRVRSRHATTDLGPLHILYVRLISIMLLHLSGKNSHSGLLRYPWNWFTGVIAARHFDLKNDRIVEAGLYVRLISLKRIDFSRLCFYIKNVLLKYLSIFDIYIKLIIQHGQLSFLKLFERYFVGWSYFISWLQNAFFCIPLCEIWDIEQ